MTSYDVLFHLCHSSWVAAACRGIGPSPRDADGLSHDVGLDNLLDPRGGCHGDGSLAAWLSRGGSKRLGWDGEPRW